MALPNTNISVPMVRDELGAATNSVRQLCIHPNINVWSKNRPVEPLPDDVTGGITEAQRNHCDFGWNIQASFIPNLTNVTLWPTGVTELWEPQLPTTWKRIGDFRGYEHTSIPLILHPSVIEISYVQLDPSGNYTFSLGEDFYASAPEGNLTYEDMDRFKYLYFGIIIRDQHTDDIRLIKTASELISTGTTASREIEVDLTNVDTGDYHFYFIATDFAVTVQITNPTPVTMPQMPGYPLHFNAANPNPITGWIFKSINYPLIVFDQWIDSPKLGGNNFYEINKSGWTSLAGSEEYAFANGNSFIELEAANTPDNPVDEGTSKYWEVEMEFQITQEFEGVGANYNLFSLNDVDNYPMALCLRTHSGGGLTEHLLYPAIYIQYSDTWYNIPHYISDWDGIHTLKFTYYTDNNYVLRIDGILVEGWSTWPVTTFDRYQTRDVRFGKNPYLNIQNSALMAHFYGKRFSLLGDTSN